MVIAVIILTRLDLQGIFYLQNTEQVRAGAGRGRAGGEQATDTLRRRPQRISWYKFKPMWQTKEAVAERLGQGGG